MKKKYLKVTRNDIVGSYIQPLSVLVGCIEGEFDGIEWMEVGTALTLTVVELDEDEYDCLEEFMGW